MRPPLPDDKSYTVTIQVEAGYVDDRVIYYAYLVTDGVVQYDLLGSDGASGFSELAAMAELLRLIGERGLTLG